MSTDSPDGGGEMPPPSQEYLDESIAPTIRGVTWVSVAIPIVFVLARCYTRLFMRRIFALEDWLILISLSLIVAYGGVIEAAVGLGLGRHIEWVLLNAPDDAVTIALLGQVSQPLVIMSCAFGKTSISVTLLRIGGSKRWIQISLWFIIVTMNILHVLVSILLFVRCEDPRVLWDTTIETTCWPVNVYLYIMYFIGAYSAASDFALALIPWAMLWGINMKKKEKFGVAFAMSLGVFAGAAAIVKCTHLDANSTSEDPTYEVGELLLWAGAENALIIIAACVPTFRPLLRAFFGSTARDSDRSYPLKNVSNNKGNAQFPPKPPSGPWTAIMETEINHDQHSDNNSDKSILKQQQDSSSADAEPGTLSPAIGNDGPGGLSPPHIASTMEVNVSYGSSSNNRANNSGYENYQ